MRAVKSLVGSPLSVLDDERVWCAWKHVAREGGQAKVPFGKDGKPARSNAPATWITRREAEMLAREKGFAGVGVFLGVSVSGHTLWGVDLDSCRNPDARTIKPWAAKIVRELDTYTEVSPSGTGVKLFGLVSEVGLKKFRAVLGNGRTGAKFARSADGPHPPAIEAYFGDRFFAVTGERWKASRKTLRLIPSSEIRRLLEEVGPAFADTTNAHQKLKDLERRGKSALDRLADYGRNRPEIAALLQGDTSGLGPDRSRSAIDFALVRYAKAAGLGKEEARAAVFVFSYGAGRGKATKGERYFERLWERAPADSAGVGAAREKPIIHDRPGELQRMVDEAEAVLVEAQVNVFQRGDHLVQPKLASIPIIGDRTVTQLRLAPLTQINLVEIMSREVTFKREKNGAAFAVDCPANVAAALLSRGKWRLRPLVAVITAPTMREDGTLLAEPGYDAQSRLLYDPLGETFPEIPDAPSQQEAAHALKTLAAPFEEFPFVSEDDRAVALSGVLSGLLNVTLRAPLHAVSGPSKGTGKSLLNDVISIIVTGTPCPVIAQGGTREELEKRLGAAVLHGATLLSIDNCTAPVQGDFLCQMLTQDVVSPRVLGSSKLVQTPASCLLFATGNNLRIASDMTRRVIYCALDAKCERPELRKFKRDARSYARENRGKLVAAALTVLRAYHVAGRPLKGRRPPLGSFEPWCHLVRDAIIWAGGGDASATIERARESDPELEALKAVMFAWAKVVGAAKIAAKDLIERASQEGKSERLLRDALFQVAGDGGVVNSRRLGGYLASMQDRVVSGRRIVKERGRSGVSLWRLEETS